ncbi:MAG: hypothetical protein HY909_06260 [Deltaproteobacteria bacterium]|nr:hypothetical protein [Deltaproteobacteria bacterium]
MVSLYLLGLLQACAAFGGSGERLAAEVRPEELAVRNTPTAAVTPQATPEEAAPRLTRGALEALIREGFGAFLARVEVSPVVARGRFVGWRLEHARDLGRWQRAGWDVRAGDVIVRVNQRTLEHPEEALAVFQSLPRSPTLRVELLREGEARSLEQPVLAR